MSAAKGKKGAPVHEKVILGRFGSNLEMGVVGLPNVGKSTFFNVLTKSSVPAENFPFCTIDPNTARVQVPDERYEWLVSHWKPASSVPASLAVTDIAGLVKGAADGEGLGNAFLSHIRAVDGIFHMLRVFEDAEVTHVEGNVDPIRDMEIITNELITKDIEMMQKNIDGLATYLKRQSNDKAKKLEFEVANKVLDNLKEGKEVRRVEWKATEIEIINTFGLLTAKPVIFLVNMTPNDFIKKKNKWLPKIKAWIDERTGEDLIPFSAAFELKLQDMSPEEREAYVKEVGAHSQLDKIVKTGYHALNLIHFFTAGEDEVKCWTIRNGTKAPQAAGKIHTDFEKNFICAEVMGYEAFHELGSESAVKAAGKYLQQGKNYIVQDGDIMLFKFGRS